MNSEGSSDLRIHLARSRVLVARLVRMCLVWSPFRENTFRIGGLRPRESRRGVVLFVVPTAGAWSDGVATILLPIIVGRAFDAPSESYVDPIANFSGIV